jgi:hypothetical protein
MSLNINIYFLRLIKRLACPFEHILTLHYFSTAADSTFDRLSVYFTLLFLHFSSHDVQYKLYLWTAPLLVFAFYFTFFTLRQEHLWTIPLPVFSCRSYFYILSCRSFWSLIRTHAARFMHLTELVTTKGFSLPEIWGLCRCCWEPRGLCLTS